MRCEKGAIAENLQSVAQYLAAAAERNIDIIGFPEMNITGYADPIRSPAVRLRLDGPEVSGLLELTRAYSGTVLAGLIEDNPAGKPFITHLVVRQGKLLGHYRKLTIIDDEAEWFSAGTGVPVFHHDAHPFGIAICADIGNESVYAECARQGARLVFELAAPGLYGEQATRNWQSGYEWWEGECQKYLSDYARKYALWIGVATQAGRTSDEDFPGGSYVFAPNGQRVYATADWSPGAVYLALDLEREQVQVVGMTHHPG